MRRWPRLAERWRYEAGAVLLTGVREDRT